MIIRYTSETWSTIGILDRPDPAEDNHILLFVIHAGGGNKAGYKNTFVKLSRIATELGYSVFRFDLPYEGESKVFVDSINKVNAIDDLFNFILQKYHFSKVVVMGHCIGGIHALNFSGKHEAIQAIVLWHVAPILYALEGKKERPVLDLKGRINQIFTDIKILPRSVSMLLKVLTSSVKLLILAIVYYLRIARLLLSNVLSNKRSVKIPLQSINKKVFVVINPSKLHYKDINDGISFLRKSLSNRGFSNVDFLENMNKVFSIQWQNIAFQGTMTYLQNQNRRLVPQIENASE